EPGVGTLRRIITQTVPNVWLWLTMLILLILAGRLFYLQAGQGEYWRNIAEGNRIRMEYLPAVRGNIVDRENRPLTRNTPSFSLVVTPADLPREEIERQSLLNDLLATVPPELIHQEEINNLSKISYLPQVIVSNLPRELALLLMVKTGNTKGVRVEAVNQREYLLSEATAHVLGYTGQISQTEYESNPGKYLLNDIVGKSGLEYSYEDLLHGVTGRKEVEIDAMGRERKIYATQSAQAGAKLTLTIDSELQQLSYQELKNVLRTVGKGGSIVALEPKTGEILALVSYPSYNPNIFTTQRDPKLIQEVLTDKRRTLYNRAVSGEYPPGSTIKPLLAVAGLADGIINTTTTVLSTGGVQLGNQFFSDWKKGGHGLTDVYKAIAESVNTFFYLLGGGSSTRRGLGISRLDYYFDLFGISHPTGVDLPGERVGFVPTPEWKLKTANDRWYRGDTYNVSIGQGNLLVTPLRLAVAYGALATSGVMRWPHLVKQVTLATGEISKIEARPLPGPNFSPEILTAVQKGMRQTIIQGSARSLQAVPIPVAGKTGTAQAGSGKPTHAWFAGYVPADDPDLVVVVMVENGGEGSTAAVPIAHKIFNWYYNKHK
ncbi:MAG: penicillin-binding protein 2, partial [Candidatus Kerfeldbacteria bacterium]|nr:penicillin-binding protein 2 [Candidatus Kerfeldbacteria bacterium]